MHDMIWPWTVCSRSAHQRSDKPWGALISSFATKLRQILPYSRCLWLCSLASSMCRTVPLVPLMTCYSCGHFLEVKTLTSSAYSEQSSFSERLVHSKSPKCMGKALRKASGIEGNQRQHSPHGPAWCCKTRCSVMYLDFIRMKLKTKWCWLSDIAVRIVLDPSAGPSTMLAILHDLCFDTTEWSFTPPVQCSQSNTSVNWNKRTSHGRDQAPALHTYWLSISANSHTATKILFPIPSNRISTSDAVYKRAAETASIPKFRHNNLLTFAEGMTTDLRSFVNRKRRWDTTTYTADKRQQ